MSPGSNTISERAPATIVEPGRASSIKLLVVDDDATNRFLLFALLEKEGYRVIVAEGGEEAVELFRRESPDLVLMDVMMPGMDGYEATQRIKAESGERFVPVIFLTALSDEQALAHCVECGGDDFLTKPYNRIILKAKIDALMRMRGLHAALLAQKLELSSHRDRLQHERGIAERVFGNILKSGSLDAPNIRYLLSPMQAVNGDLLLTARHPGGGFNYLLGDFTGHGLSAAVGAIPVTDIFHAMTGKGFHIGDIAREINRKLKSVLPPNLFFAAVLVEMDRGGGLASVWNGGVPDVLVMGANGTKQRIPSDHLPLGIIAHEHFDGSTIQIAMEQGDRIYVYSDGVIEIESPGGERYGEERLLKVLESLGADERFDAVRRELDRFRGDAPQRDDITLLEISPFHVCDGTELVGGVAGKGAVPFAHWRMVLELDAGAVRQMDPVPLLTQSVITLEQLDAHRERLYMVFAELYNNAVDHGLLQLDPALKETPEGFATFYSEREKVLEQLAEGRVYIEVEHMLVDEGGKLAVRIEDSGPGFDMGALPPELSENTSFRGRGIRVLRSLCESLTYEGRGNRVEAVYRWE